MREVHTPNDGRDPFPVLIGRHKVPKNRFDLPSSFPSVVMEISEQEIKEYYTPKDFEVSTRHTGHTTHMVHYIHDTLQTQDVTHTTHMVHTAHFTQGL